jgi:hypothetical protein
LTGCTDIGRLDELTGFVRPIVFGKADHRSNLCVTELFPSRHGIVLAIEQYIDLLAGIGV